MKRTFSDSAATNLVHPRVLNVAKYFTDMISDPNRTTSDVFREQKASLCTAREAVAHFLGCNASEVALMQSTSHSLGSLSVSLPLKKGDNVLICDLEYQASIVCWQAAIERIGFELREVKTRNGRITAADFEKYIYADTKVIMLRRGQEFIG